MKLSPDSFAALVVTTIKKALDGPKVGGRCEALEQRIQQLESRPLQKWAGVFVPGTRYTEASLVTHHGSLWVATAATTTTPGTPGNAWRLIVKSGRGAGA